jgi:hypothetical protein
MLTILMISALSLVVATIGAAVLTGREIERLKFQLKKLEQAKEHALAELEEAKQRRVSADGTVGLLENIKKDKMSARERLLTELEELKEEVLPEREITESTPLRPRTDND